MQFSLPYPPSTNHLYRPGAGGKRYLLTEVKDYRTKVSWALMQQLPRGWQTLAGPVDVRLKICPPDRMRRDLDNTLKALLDAMTKGGVYGDDSQIVSVLAEFGEPERPGHVVVEISVRVDPPTWWRGRTPLLRRGPSRRATSRIRA